MLEQTTDPRKILNKFTEEIIMSIKTRVEVDERGRIEQERMRRAIEVEKLRQKFNQYATAPQQEINKIKEVLNKPVVTQTSTSQAPTGFEKSIAQEINKKEIEAPKLIPQPLPAKKPNLPIRNIQIPETQPIEPGEIDFGKITFLVKDPMISYVECPGENKNIVIKRAGGLTTATQIILTKEEISNIIHAFSEKARIPLIEGMLDARIGNLEMSAVISESTASSFIVKRNFLPPPRTETVLQRPIQPQQTLQRPPTSMPSINRPFTREQ